MTGDFFAALFARVLPESGMSMSTAAPPPDPEVAAEQSYLEHAVASLGTMRQRAELLLRDLIAAGNPDLDYLAALSRRVSLLADSPRPLLFGRIDEEEGPPGISVVATWRTPDPIRSSSTGGRRWPCPSTGPAPRTRSGSPVVARSWSIAARSWPSPTTSSAAARTAPAPPGSGAAMPSWPSSNGPAPARCSTSSPPSRPSRTRSSALPRPAPHRAGRTGHRKDGRRAPPGGLPPLQPPAAQPRRRAGARSEPGLSALHRAGPALARRGSRRADDDRRHRPQGEGPRRGADGGAAGQGGRPHGRAPAPRPRGAPPTPRRGRASARALRSGDVEPGRASTTSSASIVARPAPYKAGRLALRARLVSEARRAFRSSGRLGADEAWFEGELTSSDEFGALLDTLWPRSPPPPSCASCCRPARSWSGTPPGCSPRRVGGPAPDT